MCVCVCVCGVNQQLSHSTNKAHYLCIHFRIFNVHFKRSKVIICTKNSNISISMDVVCEAGSQHNPSLHLPTTDIPVHLHATKYPPTLHPSFLCLLLFVCLFVVVVCLFVVVVVVCLLLLFVCLMSAQRSNPSVTRML